MSYNDTIDFLYRLQSVGIKLGLDNIRELLARLGNPERTFRSIHVAGTNGKGSTCAMLASMLEAAGINTGLFTSPHLLSFTERIRAGGKEITKQQVAELAAGARAASHDMTPTFFEVVTAMAFMHFRATGVQWALVETGLGGRLDSTNVIAPEVTLITPVSMDHMEFLGDTLKDVAGEKAGIIKPGVPVLSAPQAPEALEVIKNKADLCGSELYVLGEDFHYEIERATTQGVTFTYRDNDITVPGLAVPLAGQYQALNAAMALRAFSMITNTISANSFASNDFPEAARRGLKDTRWPGRLELVAGDPPTYIDCAHNPAASSALANELRERPIAAPEDMVLVLGVMGDKEVKSLIGPLLPLASETICTAPAYGRAMGTGELTSIARALGAQARDLGCVANAIKEARATGKTVLVAGSFYTAGEVLEALGAHGVLSNLRESTGSAPR